MITDQKLYDYLNQDVIETLIPIQTSFITPEGTLLPEWGIRFNQLSEDKMFEELHFIIQELMVMDIDDQLRLNLIYEVGKVGQILIGKLHVMYWNQTGLLNQEQQNALDRVLSIYYATIIFYYSVWQRLAATTDMVEEKTSLSFFKRFGKPTKTPHDIIKRCIFSMMVLLKQCLLEKQIGYRQNTEVIWQYLNACYNFTLTYGWQTYSFDLNTILNYNGIQSIEQIYRQCLLADLIQPYAYRRHDLLKLHTGLEEWANYLQLTDEALTKPYLYVDLQGSAGTQLLAADTNYNPFSPNSRALFVNIEPILISLKNLIAQPATSHEVQRLAKLVLPNLEKILLPDIVYIDMHEPCQIIVGFHHIHFILAGKTSLDNLIHSHQLPERVRPAIQPRPVFDKTNQAVIYGKLQQYRKLYFSYLYQPQEETHHTLRTPSATSINLYQVSSMVAIYADDKAGTKSWNMGKLLTLKQQPLTATTSLKKALSDIDTSQELGIEMQVELLGKGIVPCGVRLASPESRLPRFMPALIIPKSEELNRPSTSLMMARFGYQLNDKVIIRIDNKEVQARLTELVSLTDDIEEYNFVRIT